MHTPTTASQLLATCPPQVLAMYCIVGYAGPVRDGLWVWTQGAT